MASPNQHNSLKIGRGVLLDKEVASTAVEADSKSVMFMDVSGTNDSVVCIISDREGAGANNFRVFVEDPTIENVEGATPTDAEATIANSFLMYSRNVVADTVLRINVPGGFGSRMFCVFTPDSGSANVKIWAWSASSQGRR